MTNFTGHTHWKLTYEPHQFVQITILYNQFMFSHKLLLLANHTSHRCEMHITPLSLCYSYTRSVMHGVNEMLVVVYICLARHMYKPEWVYGIYTIIRVVPLLYTHTGESIRHSLLPWICGESFVFLGGGLVIH